MTCPQCNSDDLRVDPYGDIDSSVGYKDCGVKVTCRTCDAVSTEAEMDAAHAEAAYVDPMVAVLDEHLRSLPEPVYVAPVAEISIEDLPDAMPDEYWI